jgi:hypothetical protein
MKRYEVIFTNGDVQVVDSDDYILGDEPPREWWRVHKVVSQPTKYTFTHIKLNSIRSVREIGEEKT